MIIKDASCDRPNISISIKMSIKYLGSVYCFIGNEL